MIELKPKIKNDLSSSINNFDLLFIINSSSKTYYLSTQSQTLDGIYYDDLIMKVGGLKESINLRDKKIKLSGTSITINNAEMSGIRFSDTIVGEMTGGVIDIYIKTQSCESLDDCNKIASLKITGVTHDSSKIDLKCEDRFIDEFHKELPLSEHTLYQDEQTFVGDNERRIPVLYGHLKQAPAVVYIDDHETEAPFADNNILIVPDRAFKDDYDIIGIKNINARTSENDLTNQLINQDTLFIKLGDHAANVYSEPPDRLNKRLVEGDWVVDYKYPTDWESQFIVEGDYINLVTQGDGTNQENIPTGNLFCGELSKLISYKTYKARYFLPILDTDDNAEVYVKTDISDVINSSNSQPEYFDMLSVYPVKYDNNGQEVDCEYQTEEFDIGDQTYKNFDVPIVEFEFEPLKSSISKSQERTIDTRSDGKLISSFKAINNKYHQVFDDDGAERTPRHWEFGFFPQKANFIVNPEFKIDQDLNNSNNSVELTSQPLGAVRNVYSSLTSDINPVDEEPYSVYGDWITEYNRNIAWISAHFYKGCPIRIWTQESSTENSVDEVFTDYRHTFHTTQQNVDNIQGSNTWRAYYKFLDSIDYVNQNIITTYMFPYFPTTYCDDDWNLPNNYNDIELRYRQKALFSGMFYQRSWYQKECFNENFFVNAKGKYIEAPNSNDRLYHSDHIRIEFTSNSVDVANEHRQVHQEDETLLQLIDYLTNDRLKTYYANGYRYELVIDCQNWRYDTNPTQALASWEYQDEQQILFDIDVNNFDVFHNDNANNVKYSFDLSSNIFRVQTTSNWVNYNDLSSLRNFKLRYARRNLTSLGEIDSWTFADEEELTPFVAMSDNDIVDVALLEYENDNTNNKFVKGKIHGDKTSSGLDQLIRKPSDVTDDIVKKEFGFPQNSQINKKNVEDDKYFLDFSLYEKEEGIDVMQKISQSSPFFYKTSISDGIPSIVGIKPFYADDDVDKSINENQIINYKFRKTKIEDVAIKCRVKYGFDYVKEEYTKTTPDIEHNQQIKQNYIDLYDIKDEDTYVLEHEAPYIQERLSAEVLAKHLFEINKNQHLILSFQIPLGDGLELEVGDTIDFVDNSGSRTNIGNTKPYGMDMTIENIIIDQVVYPYFMITSIKKDLTKVNIECVQLHALAPSEYDDWEIAEVSEEEVIDIPTGDVTGDDNLDIFDVIQVLPHIFTGEGLDENQQFQADLDQDGSVTVQDVIIMLNTILNINVDTNPIANLSLYYDFGGYPDQQIYDGDTIPVTTYITVDGGGSYSPYGNNIVEWRWIRVRNGVPMPDSVQDSHISAFAGGTWEGECSITLIVTDSQGNQSSPKTISWTGV